MFLCAVFAKPRVDQEAPPHVGFSLTFFMTVLALPCFVQALSGWVSGGSSLLGAQVSHWGGFSCGAQNVGMRASEVAAHGLNNSGTWTLFFQGMWDLPRPGTELVFPALAGRLLAPVAPGNSSAFLLFWHMTSLVAAWGEELKTVGFRHMSLWPTSHRLEFSHMPQTIWSEPGKYLPMAHVCKERHWWRHHTALCLCCLTTMHVLWGAFRSSFVELYKYPQSAPKEFQHIFLTTWLCYETCMILVPDQGWNLHPLHWKHAVLTTGPPRKSPSFNIFLL